MSKSAKIKPLDVKYSRFSRGLVVEESVIIGLIIGLIEALYVVVDKLKDFHGGRPDGRKVISMPQVAPS